MPDPLEVSVSADPPARADVEGTSEFPVTASPEAVVQATSELAVPAISEQPLEAARELLADGSADPHAAHSPMSPDDQVSDKHTGLSYEPHTIAGTAPQS